MVIDIAFIVLVIVLMGMNIATYFYLKRMFNRTETMLMNLGVEQAETKADVKVKKEDDLSYAYVDRTTGLSSYKAYNVIRKPSQE